MGSGFKLFILTLFFSVSASAGPVNFQQAQIRYGLEYDAQATQVHAKVFNSEDELGEFLKTVIAPQFADSSGKLKIETPAQFLARLYPQLNVDFNSQSLVLVFFGMKATGGFWLEVKDVNDTDSALRISYLGNGPGLGCMVTEALTFPAVAVVVPKTAKNLALDGTVRAENCN